VGRSCSPCAPTAGVWQDSPVMTEIPALVSVFGFDPANPPKTLYHYTSMAALLAIVDSGRMRATHFRYLNDRSEVGMMWNLVEKRLEERIAAAESNAVDVLRGVREAVKNRNLTNEYVASFSEKGDDLSQWRSYCQSGSE
jgi:hypothetical protein